VPANVPLGCAVPLSMQIGSFISNSVSLPIAATGSRTCTPSDPTLPPAIVTPLSTGSGPFTFADIELARTDQYPGLVDSFRADFVRFTIPSTVQPFFVSYVDSPPVGSCQTYQGTNGTPDPPFVPVATLDPGPQITVQGPNGTKTVAASGGEFRGTLSANGTYLSAGSYTVSAPGGADVPKFSTQITIPTMPTLTSPPPDAATATTVTRSSGLTVTWAGGQANGILQLQGFNATDNTNTVGANFVCAVPAAAGTFTVPPSVLMALPASNLGGLLLVPFATPAAVTGTGLNVAFINASYSTFTPLNFK